MIHSSIETHKFPIQQIISASAIGIYPDSKTRYYEEEFQGTDASFLRTVVKSWEGRLKPFQSLGIKTTAVRIGIVLDAKEGALPKIMGPIKRHVIGMYYLYIYKEEQIYKKKPFLKSVSSNVHNKLILFNVIALLLIIIVFIR